MPIAIALDVYGTLVDPLAITERLRTMVGDLAVRFAELWRAKQLEYSFRRGLMRAYQPFSVCTAQALLFAERALGVSLSDEARNRLMADYTLLPPFPDAARGLASARRAGYSLAAFSNGGADALRAVLENAGLLSMLDDVVSADEVETFKPDPRIYAHAVARLGRPANETWLVSSNSFDLIGAKAAAMRAAWVKRDSQAVFDPWGVEPDIVVENLEQLAAALARAGYDSSA